MADELARGVLVNVTPVTLLPSEWYLLSILVRDMDLIDIALNEKWPSIDDQTPPA